MPKRAPASAQLGEGHTLSGFAIALRGILFVALAMRLPALWGLPLFNDEAVYLLRAERFPAMLASFGAAIGRTLGQPGAGLLAWVLYALSPLALIHDLLALPDAHFDQRRTALGEPALRPAARW